MSISDRTDARTEQSGHYMDHDRFWLILFTLYYVFHFGIRLVTGAGLGLDEAEMLIAGQKLAWGYGPQLPLYAWMQWVVFQFTGPNLFGLSILKYGLLWAIVSIFFLAVRQFHPARIAGISVLYLLTLPQISWEAQHDLTHSVLVTFASVLTLYALLKILRDPSPRYFVAFGLVIAVGGLSKYNYFFVLPALMIAAISEKTFRKNLLTPWLILAGTIGGALLVRPYLWIYEYQHIALNKIQKFKMVDDPSVFLIAAKGLGALLLASLGFTAPAIIVALIIWLIYRNKEAVKGLDPLNQLMIRAMLIQIAIVAVTVMFSRSTFIKERWMLPILIFSGPAIALWLIPRITPLGQRRLIQTSAVLSIIIALMLIPYSFVGRSYRNAPFDDLAAQLVPKLPPNAELIASNWIAGNLINFAPKLTAYPIEGVYQKSDRSVVIWEADLAPPLPVVMDQITVIEARYHNANDQVLRLAFARLAQ